MAQRKNKEKQDSDKHTFIMNNVDFTYGMFKEIKKKGYSVSAYITNLVKKDLGIKE